MFYDFVFGFNVKIYSTPFKNYKQNFENLMMIENLTKTSRVLRNFSEKEEIYNENRLVEDFVWRCI